MEKKFIIDGSEYFGYQLSNEQIINLIDGGNLTKEENDYLNEKIRSRFESSLCKRSDETGDDVFARFFSDYVNNCGHNPSRAAERMARDHRTLQSNMFMVCLEYIKVLAKNYEDGYYDPRNEYACKTSKKIIDNFKEMDYPY